MNRVSIDKLVRNVDLRKIHDYRKKYRKGLRPGHAVLLMNAARNKVRIIDCEGGCYNHYAPSGQEYDLELIQMQVAALRLELRLDPQGRKALSWKVQQAA